MNNISDGWDTREDRSALAPFEPAVNKGCICRNQGKPDADGLIYLSPSCEFPGHGVQTLYIEKSPIQSGEIGAEYADLTSAYRRRGTGNRLIK